MRLLEQAFRGFKCAPPKQKAEKQSNRGTSIRTPRLWLAHATLPILSIDWHDLANVCKRVARRMVAFVVTKPESGQTAFGPIADGSLSSGLGHILTLDSAYAIKSKGLAVFGRRSPIPIAVCSRPDQ